MPNFTPPKALFLALCATALLGACAVVNPALEAVGLKVPEVPQVPDSMKPPRNVSIALHAGETLNIAPNGRSSAVIARIYKLKQANAFQQAPYETFLNPQKEQEVLGADLLEVKEVTLIPGQRFETTEKVSQEAGFIGIVALYRKPAPARWRVVFPAKEAEGTGIIVGVHGCSLTVGTGQTDGNSAIKSQLLSSVRCD